MKKTKPGNVNAASSKSGPSHFWTDKKAYIFFLILFFIFILPVIVKPLGYVPAFRFYFEGLGEYFAGYYSPYQTHTFYSEIDSLEYYSYLPSMVIDHDFDFSNQFRFFGITPKFSKTGKPINEFSIGPAILWLPFFLLGHLLSLFLNLVGVRVPVDGFSLLYELPCYFGSILYGFIGILIAYKMCREFFDSKDSFFASVFLLFATPLVFYFEFEPSMSHALSFFTATACMYFYYKNFEKRSLWRWALIGFFGGLTTLIRWQCATLIFLVLLVDFIYVLHKSVKARDLRLLIDNLAGWFLCGAVSVITFMPQVIAWFGFLAGPGEIPQVTRDASKYLFPAILETLFHYYHGVFSWTPIAVPSLVGFAYFTRRKFSPTAVVIWLFYLSEIYLIAVSDWTSGWSFGQRRLIEAFIIYALGIGEILHRFKGNKLLYNLSIGVGIFLVWFNLVFIYQWKLHYIPGGGFLNSLKELYLDKFIIFPDMLRKAMVPITGLFNIW